MTITADYHMHSSFSGDSDAPMEQMIRQAVSAGIRRICFTEHQDFDYPPCPDTPAGFWTVDMPVYRSRLYELKEKYAGQIQICFGIELGLQPHLAQQNAGYIRSYDFDFVIGSSHVCNRQDPYYPVFFAGKTEEEAYREYFTSILENIRVFTDFDVYGHLDYIVRYGPNQDKAYTYEKYRDIFDAILELLLEKGKGLEINTAGLRYGPRQANPCSGILKRYRALGGSVVTVGSDAHKPSQIGWEFERAAALLKECGFTHYTTFCGRMPEYHRL